MKKNIILAMALSLPLAGFAQGNNTGMGGNDGDYESLAHTDKLSYRFRHRLNKNNTAQSEDNFAKATDILMVGYQFTPKLGVQAGKMCQNWGGFEFDENPMYIYQYSDMVDYMDNFMAGVNVSYKPVPTQEIAVNITDAYNNKFADEYGAGATSLETNSVRHLESSNHPLTYIGLWAGSFLDGKLQTRWSCPRTEAQPPEGAVVLRLHGCLRRPRPPEDSLVGGQRLPRSGQLFQRRALQLIHHQAQLAVCATVEPHAQRHL